MSIRSFSLSASIFAILVIPSLPAIAQNILPKHGDTLNFTQVMFEFPQAPGAVSYLLEVADITAGDGQVVWKKKVNSLAYLATTGIEFGKSYSWKYSGYDSSGNEVKVSEAFTFHTGTAGKTQAERFTLKVNHADHQLLFPSLVVFDAGVVSDKQGRVVHFFPNNDGTLRNLVLNKDGHFTYTDSHGAFEADLKGKATWEAPMKVNNMLIKNYHHDIKKLGADEFMLLAEKANAKPDDKNIYSLVFATDRKGNVKWLWDEEPFYRDRPDTVTSNHINAIDFDPVRGILFTSSRNIHTISKISTQTASIRYTIGSCVPGDQIPCYPVRLFSGQHSVSVLPDKNLLLFNNNTDFLDAGQSSGVMEIKQPMPGDVTPEVVWQYSLDFQDAENNKCPKAGDADLLPNGNIMITCGANNKVIEVTRGKKVVWECTSFKRDSDTDPWTPQSSYRTHYISSLYPCFFTVETWKNGQTVKLNNDGSEDDEYTLTFTSAGSKVKAPPIKVAVKAFSSREVRDLESRLNAFAKKGAKTTVAVKITSGLRPSYSKTVSLVR